MCILTLLPQELSAFCLPHQYVRYLRFIHQRARICNNYGSKDRARLMVVAEHIHVSLQNLSV